MGLCACGHINNGAELNAGDYADAITTVEVIASPDYVELNPWVPNDPVVGPAALLGMKYGTKYVMIEAGYTPEFANQWVESVAGWAPFCNNVLLFLGAEPVIRIAGGMVCASLTYPHNVEPRIEQ